MVDVGEVCDDGSTGNGVGVGEGGVMGARLVTVSTSGGATDFSGRLLGGTGVCTCFSHSSISLNENCSFSFLSKSLSIISLSSDLVNLSISSLMSCVFRAALGSSWLIVLSADCSGKGGGGGGTP